VFQQSVGVVLTLMVALSPAAARAGGLRSRLSPPLRPPAAHAAGPELIISYDSCCPAGDRERMARACGAIDCREGYGSTFHVLTLAPGRDPQAAAQQLRQDRRVRFAEPNGRVTSFALATDPYFSPYQWNLSDTGYGIRVPSAWDRTMGAGVTVAVVDTGIAYEEYGGFKPAPELMSTSFAGGWDFINNDAHPNDDNGHGSHVAGIIASGTNNGFGCAGIAPEARLMPIKVLNADGTGPTSLLAEGIRYAADHGAQVINVSLGTAQSSEALREAVLYARGKGCVIVAAAGNDGGSSPVYPAAYAGVINVGASRFDGQRTFYSNFGPTLSVVAPGGDPKVDQNNDGFNDGILQQTFSKDHPDQFGFYFKAGTSQAAPHVTGVAALVLSAQPGLTPDRVQEAIERTATDLGPPGRDDQFGYGLVNAAAAVNYVPTLPTTMAGGLPDTRTDSSPYNFEAGGFHGWSSTDNARASILNTGVTAYRGQKSLQVSLKGITDYTTGIIRVAPNSGASIPVGRQATAYVQATAPGGVSARIVLYDNLGQPVVGPFVPLVPGRWLPVSVTVPSWSSGPYRWIFIHFRGNGYSYTGTCYVDSINWG
jgi:serine protease